MSTVRTPEIDQAIRMMSRLPGLGPRSAQRAILHLLAKPDQRLALLLQTLKNLYDRVTKCEICANIDTTSPCSICRDDKRSSSLICVVEDVGGLWAMERSGAFDGKYQVLSGVLSAIDGIRPSDLKIGDLLSRVQTGEVEEVILALGATVDGQITAHYISQTLSDCQVKVSGLARGVPLGGELDYLDDATLTAALLDRRGM